MTIRADIVELLHAGYGDRTIARHLDGVSISDVARAREALGLPKARSGIKPAESLEDAFWRRVQIRDDGHMDWTGNRNSKGTPTIGWRGGHYSALRVAYRIRTGQDPAGYAFTSCSHPGCVAPAHTGDTAVEARPAHHPGGTGRKPNGSREQVVDLLKEGLSDKQVAQRLRTNPKRVSRIRAEEGIPPYAPRPRTLEELWAAHTQPVDGGHVLWTGGTSQGRPVVRIDGATRSVLKIAFRREYGRDPDGPVQPGCGMRMCVAGPHLEDRPMRQRTEALYAAIFGDAA